MYAQCVGLAEWIMTKLGRDLHWDPGKVIGYVRHVPGTLYPGISSKNRHFMGASLCFGFKLAAAGLGKRASQAMGQTAALSHCTLNLECDFNGLMIGAV